MERVYENRDGRQVVVSGPAVIEEVMHRCNDYYIVCNSSLNQKAWGTTEQKSVCKICYPEPEQKPDDYKPGQQLKLF
jgi:hypothetical protein